MSKKAVLAYSGGLDTSVILRWLQEKGYEVVAFIADVGQREDLSEQAERARRIGVAEVFVEDLRREFVTDYVFPAVAGNAVYENRYLLGTSLARPLIAKHQVEVARRVGARAVAHGATGKGNDQVRFELTYAALAPRMEIIAPWKDREFLDRFRGRADLIRYAKEESIPLESTSGKPYSMDENLMHKSYESGILEDPMAEPAEEMFQLTTSPMAAPDQPGRVEIHFKDAMPVKVIDLDSGEEKVDPLELFVFLNDLAGLHRQDHGIAAQHQKFAMGEVDHPHHAVNDRQPDADQRQAGDRIRDLNDEDRRVVHGVS
jgi:argininosuccinate synthase